MDSSSFGLRVASAVFALVAILQLIRLVMQFEITVNSHIVPYWPNAIALVVAAGLSAWLWRLSSMARFGGTH